MEIDRAAVEQTILRHVGIGAVEESALAMAVGTELEMPYVSVLDVIWSMLHRGDLVRDADGKIRWPDSRVTSEEPPVYAVGDDDDGEIPDPPLPKAAALQRPGADLPPTYWVVFDGENWTFADTEDEARRIAERQPPASIYRWIGTCKMRVEWG